MRHTRTWFCVNCWTYLPPLKWTGRLDPSYAECRWCVVRFAHWTHCAPNCTCTEIYMHTLQFPWTKLKTHLCGLKRNSKQNIDQATWSDRSKQKAAGCNLGWGREAELILSQPLPFAGMFTHFLSWKYPTCTFAKGKSWFQLWMSSRPCLVVFLPGAAW